MHYKKKKNRTSPVYCSQMASFGKCIQLFISLHEYSQFELNVILNAGLFIAIFFHVPSIGFGSDTFLFHFWNLCRMNQPKVGTNLFWYFNKRKIFNLNVLSFSPSENSLPSNELKELKQNSNCKSAGSIYSKLISHTANHTDSEHLFM